MHGRWQCCSCDGATDPYILLHRCLICLHAQNATAGRHSAANCEDCACKWLVGALLISAHLLFFSFDSNARHRHEPLSDNLALPRLPINAVSTLRGFSQQATVLGASYYLCFIFPRSGVCCRTGGTDESIDSFHLVFGEFRGPGS